MSNEFNWTADLVTEFCEYAGMRIGKSIDIKQQVNLLMEDFKRLKASKQPVKDYEIVSFEGLYDEIVKWKPENNYGLNYNEWLLGCQKYNYKIHSVKRLSDNEVFSIGDEVQLRINRVCQIIKFEIVGGGEVMYVYGEFIYKNSVQATDLLEIQKAKQPVKLFTTSDNKPIYYGEYCWVVSPETSFGWQPLKVLMNSTPLDERGKYFSTEESAKEWILMNKPMFSINEIKEASREEKHGFYWFDEAKLMHLAGIKLKQ